MDPVLAQIRVFETMVMVAFVRRIPRAFKAVYLKMQLSSNKASLLKSRQIRELLVRLAMNSVSKVEEEESLTIGICPRKRQVAAGAILMLLISFSVVVTQNTHTMTIRLDQLALKVKVVKLVLVVRVLHRARKMIEVVLAVQPLWNS